MAGGEGKARERGRRVITARIPAGAPRVPAAHPIVYYPARFPMIPTPFQSLTESSQ